MFRFRTILKATTVTALIAAAAWGIKYATAPAYDGTVGITYGEAFAPVRQVDLDFHILYPAQCTESNYCNDDGGRTNEPHLYVMGCLL